MKPLGACRLYTFVDTGYLQGRKPVEVAAQLCDGGADIIQLRAKDWTPDQITRTAELLLPVCEMNGVLLVINDHPEIAARVGAPLAHLGQEDFFHAGHSSVSEITRPLSAREAGGERLQIGLSTHAPDQAQRAIAAGAAYIAVGPVYATPTKPGRPATTLGYVAWAAENAGAVPWFAIGGITLENLDEVLAAGARRICVVSAILNAANIASACREFRRLLG